MQRELAVIIREEMDDKRLGMVTIQEVRVVRDLSHATVFFTQLGGSLTEKETAKILNEASPFLRHELGRSMKIRIMPELHFVYDDSLSRGNTLSDLIEQAISEDEKHHHEE